MNRPRTGALLVLVLAGTTGCTPMVSRRQSEAMETFNVETVTAAGLRARVSDLADRMAGRLAATADAIRAATQDRAVRRSALVLKADTVPAVYAASFRADP